MLLCSLGSGPWAVRAGAIGCVGIGKGLVSLSRPRMVKVLGIAPSSVCTNDQRRARGSVVGHASRVVRRKTSVVSVNTCSSHPGTRRVDPRRRVHHLHAKLRVVGHCRPNYIISISAFHTSMTRVYMRRCKITVVGSVTTKRVSPRVFSVVTELKMPCVVVRVRNAPRGVRVGPRCSGLLGRIFLCFSRGMRGLHSLKMGSVVLSPNFNFKGAIRRGCRLVGRLRRFDLFRLPLLINVSHGSVVCGLLNKAPSSTLGKAAILSAVSLLGKTSVLEIRSMGTTMRAIGVMRGVGSSTTFWFLVFGFWF